VSVCKQTNESTRFAVELPRKRDVFIAAVRDLPDNHERLNYCLRDDHTNIKYALTREEKYLFESYLNATEGRSFKETWELGDEIGIANRNAMDVIGEAIVEHRNGLTQKYQYLLQMDELAWREWHEALVEAAQPTKHTITPWSDEFD